VEIEDLIVWGARREENWKMERAERTYFINTVRLSKLSVTSPKNKKNLKFNFAGKLFPF
jgi:hypothetical protein